jgi:hypothetical protein
VRLPELPTKVVMWLCPKCKEVLMTHNPPSKSGYCARCKVVRELEKCRKIEDK